MKKFYILTLASICLYSSVFGDETQSNRSNCTVNCLFKTNSKKTNNVKSVKNVKPVKKHRGLFRSIQNKFDK